MNTHTKLDDDDDDIYFMKIIYQRYKYDDDVHFEMKIYEDLFFLYM